MEKALGVCINSSVGIGAMLVNRSNKAPTYPRFSLNDLRRLRVPDFGILGQLAEEKLAGAYDELAANVLLPQMDGSRARREMAAAVYATLTGHRAGG